MTENRTKGPIHSDRDAQVSFILNQGQNRPQVERYYFDSRIGELDLRGKSILDLGCGNGRFALYTLLAGGASTVVGIDSYEGHGGDSGNHSRVLSLIEELGIQSRVEIIRGDFFSDLGARTFDTVFANNSFHHIIRSPKRIGKDPNTYQEFHRVCHRLWTLLNPGGSLAIEEVMPYNIAAQVPFWHRLRGTSKIGWKTKQTPWDHRLVLSDVGFRDISFRWARPWKARWMPLLFDNPLGAYLTYSAFYLKANRPPT